MEILLIPVDVCRNFAGIIVSLWKIFLCLCGG